MKPMYWNGTKWDVAFNGAGTATAADLQTALANVAMQIECPTYVASGFYPGIVWNTTDSSGTKPKAGIYMQTQGTGSFLFFGTSNNYATGITQAVCYVNPYGEFTAAKTYNPAFADIAEQFKKNEEIEAGDIVIRNPNGDGYIKSRRVYDNLVVGVCSSPETYGHLLGAGLKEEEAIPIGLAGKVKVKVTGHINIGDLITASDIPGVGMKSETYVPGTIVGKALQSHDSSSVNKIEMLIMNI